MTATVTTLESRRRTWTPVRELTAEWVLGIECPWCKAHFTVDVAQAVDRPVYPPCCGGAPLRVLAGRLPGAPY